MITRTVVVVAVCYVSTTVSGATTEVPSKGASIGSTRIPYIFDIVADPSEPGAVLLATRGGLYRARQDGTAERISRKRNPFWSLSVGGVNGTRFLARGFADDSRSAAVVVSEDQGQSWQGLPSGGYRRTHPNVVEVSKADPNVAYAGGYAFWRSTDGGHQWVLAYTPPSYILDLAASAIDAKRIFAATLSDLHVSTDGGLSWKTTAGTKCRQPVMAVDTGTDGTVYAFSLCVGLLRGDERTGSWVVVNNEFGGCIVQHLTVNPDNSARLYAVLRCHAVLVSADGGVTWRELGSRGTWKPSCLTYPVGRIDADS